MLVHPWDAPAEADDWRGFVDAQGFGQLVAAGVGREVAVVVPTQFLLDDDTVLLHLARPNPVWRAIEENPAVLLCVAGDWTYVPSAWKAIGGEDPSLGIPTTYYAAVQLRCEAVVLDDPGEKLAVLRRQLAALEPELESADPSVHESRFAGIRGLRAQVREVTAKFKYGGNVDQEHRAAVAERLAERAGPGDDVARLRVLNRNSGVEG